ncbi:hypothetical protein GYMLUDRAFT_969271 [Collybiopsis luxurians FD-317 M1]|uniref:Uncharacterized protein n=1 Tax=Collybiopsis luxurians FD-317 M1 TaxID=944289 RepID=A0A0D0CBT7_9AGAR|nr:hypothetical protein GYMLUDRAFT_969271 [Collybiopsis luxurians FD-317 M1]
MRTKFSIFYVFGAHFQNVQSQIEVEHERENEPRWINTGLTANYSQMMIIDIRCLHPERVKEVEGVALSGVPGGSRIWMTEYVSAIQGWYYFTHHKDHWPLRSLVVAVLSFDFTH